MEVLKKAARFLILGTIFVFSVSPAAAQPNVAAVVNAASFEPFVAPGSIVAIYGTQLAQSTVSATPPPPLPTMLDGVTVTVNGIDAPLYFVSPGQINAQIPFEITAAKASMTVSTRQGQSAAYSVDLMPVAPGIFTRSADGRGTPILLSPSFTLLDTVTPGERVVFYATGLGITDPPAVTGSGGAGAEPLNRAVDMPEVYVGGRQALVEYAGLAPGFVGVYQLNIVAPSNLITQEFFILSRGRRSNSTTISASVPAPVVGSGVSGSETRQIGDFRRIQLFAVGDVEVQVGQAVSLRVEADDNVLPLITTRVRDGALKIASERPYNTPQGGVKISVSVPTLDGVDLLGVGNFTITGVSGDSFVVGIIGVGSVTASGSVGSVEVFMQGVGSASFFNLAAQHVRVWSMGVGSAEVNATASLFARVFGLGNVVYSGNPAEVDGKVEGLGSIRPR
jgi:uncharacterized protein (TIGR03437 family)